MPIECEDIINDPICFGGSWSEKTREMLIVCISDLLDGHYLKVARIIRNNISDSEATKYGRAALKKKLTESSTDHRDGWLFQMISYICLLKKFASDKNCYLANPHIQPADKGFDNLLLKVDSSNNQIEYILITEDKATTRPRAVFRDDILPEFKSIENDERTGHLRTCASVLLQKAKLDDDEVEKEIARFFWERGELKDENILRFRASLIVENKIKYKKLFKDYEKAISGDKIRRRAEIFKVNNTRKWLQELSEDILKHIEK